MLEVWGASTLNETFVTYSFSSNELHLSVISGLTKYTVHCYSKCICSAQGYDVVDAVHEGKNWTSEEKQSVQTLLRWLQTNSGSCEGCNYQSIAAEAIQTRQVALI